VLWWMWIAHFLLFRGGGNIAWFGTLIVIENMVSSTVHTHLFDSVHGWLYVFGVGVLGGMVLHKRMIGPKRGHEADDESYSIIARPDRYGRD
jgi:hypothetical protein